ncbi:hypothetical protein [Candidatus Hodarchaeum mangrovi]
MDKKKAQQINEQKKAQKKAEFDAFLKKKKAEREERIKQVSRP